jgi:hypothetical protein
MGRLQRWALLAGVCALIVACGSDTASSSSTSAATSTTSPSVASSSATDPLSVSAASRLEFDADLHTLFGSCPSVINDLPLSIGHPPNAAQVCPQAMAALSARAQAWLSLLNTAQFPASFAATKANLITGLSLFLQRLPTFGSVGLGGGSDAEIQSAYHALGNAVDIIRQAAR